MTHDTRRDFLRAGSLGFLGMGLPGYLAAAPAASAKVKSVILFWLEGGPSHIDTWDPKANSNFKPITTTYFLIDAIYTYEALTNERPPILRTFQLWMMIHNLELVKEQFRAEWTTRLARLGLDVRRMPKQEFFADYLAVLARAGSR